MNIQDISPEDSTIYIRGKGHNDLIYPRPDTMELLKKYVNMREVYPSYPTPVFTSQSNNSRGKRLSRIMIRDSIDKALKQLELKAPGKKPRPLQIRRMKQITALGIPCYVIDAKEQIGGVLDAISSP